MNRCSRKGFRKQRTIAWNYSHAFGHSNTYANIAANYGCSEYGWRNLDGKPVENRDLWKRLLSIRAKVTVRTDLKWMLGKKSAILKSVDKAAKIAASQPWKTDLGFKGGKVGRSKGGSKRAAGLFPATGQDAVL